MSPLNITAVHSAEGFDGHSHVTKSTQAQTANTEHSVAMAQNDSHNYLHWKLPTPCHSLPQHNKHPEPQLYVLLYDVNSS